MPDSLPQPQNFSADDFAGFSSVFAYNARYVPAAKILAEGPDGRRLTYGTVDRLTARLCGWFAAQGLQRGDRAVILSQDDLAVTTLFLGCLRYGVTAVVISPEAGAEEQQTLLQAAQAQATLIDKALISRLKPPGIILPITPGAGPEAPSLLKSLGGQKEDPSSFPGLIRNASPLTEASPAADDSAYILFTSGTTSRPKGVEVTHGNLLVHMQTLIRHYGYDPASRILNILPLHHADGLLQGPVVAFVTGATCYRPIRFAVDRVPALLDSVYKFRITHMVAVPAMLQLIDTLGEKKVDTFRDPSFRFIISTAGYLDPQLWARFEQRFGTMIVNVYGLTETVCESLYCGPDEATRKIGTIGKPVDTECRVVNDAGADVPPGQAGELWLRGPHIMKGYFQMPAETAEVMTEDGWLKTGDLCVVDEDGFYNVVGRKKNVIIVGGMNVYPDDVANILRKLPGVLDAAVWGEADDTWGETVMAAVLPQPGATLDQALLSESFLLHGEVTMLPRHIHIVSAFPRGPAGKVIMRDLRASLSVQQEAALPTASHTDLTEAVLATAAQVFKCSPDQLSLSSTAETVKGWNSLAHVEFLLSLEKQFGITIEPRDILSVRSLADALAVVKAKKKDL
ncbi:MAG: AMP-binding protein [Alphaproteobacteria bacterium]|nr:AMP-binding protein [Alphaproteobacteria bacterium]